MNKNTVGLAVDKDKLNISDSSCETAPLFYYDKIYNCVDCEKEEVWTAQQQKYWYEEERAYLGSHAIRCTLCRAWINALKEEQQRHMKYMASKHKAT
jgi:hypothetical protein